MERSRRIPRFQPHQSHWQQDIFPLSWDNSILETRHWGSVVAGRQGDRTGVERTTRDPCSPMSVSRCITANSKDGIGNTKKRSCLFDQPEDEPAPLLCTTNEKMRESNQIRIISIPFPFRWRRRPNGFDLKCLFDHRIDAKPKPNPQDDCQRNRELRHDLHNHHRLAEFVINSATMESQDAGRQFSVARLHGVRDKFYRDAMAPLLRPRKPPSRSNLPYQACSVHRYRARMHAGLMGLRSGNNCRSLRINSSYSKYLRRGSFPL